MPHAVSAEQLLFSALVVVCAYLVRGVAGFGSGLIAIPLLALVLPLSVVVPMVVFLDYLASSMHGVRNASHIQWPVIWPLLPFSLLGVLLALYVFHTVDDAVLSKVLGGFIIAYALYSLLARDSGRQTSRYWAVPAGALGGFIGTLFGTGGPFYVLYLKHQGLLKTPFRATFATIFLLEGAGRLTGYLASGFYTLDILWLMALAAPIAFLGLYVGGHIHTVMTQTSFQRGIGILLLGSGLALLMR